MADSTLAFDCPDTNDPDNSKELQSRSARIDIAVDGTMAQVVPGKIELFEDYGLADPLRAAQAVAGIDAVDAETAWVDVFD